MEFEWDSAKSSSNARKHGIDFVEAQKLFADPNAISFKVWDEPEERWALLAMLHGKHWTAIYTHRSGRVRIISVRRSRKKEERAYDEGFESQG